MASSTLTVTPPEGEGEAANAPAPPPLMSPKGQLFSPDDPIYPGISPRKSAVGRSGGVGVGVGVGIGDGALRKPGLSALTITTGRTSADNTPRLPADSIFSLPALNLLRNSSNKSAENGDGTGSAEEPALDLPEASGFGINTTPGGTTPPYPPPPFDAPPRPRGMQPLVDHWVFQPDPAMTHVLRKIRVVQYNVLADTYALEQAFPYVKRKYLSWEYRRVALVKELLSYDADIIALQEVDHFTDFLQPHLRRFGYEGAFCKRPGTKQDGCAIFYRRTLFTARDTMCLDYNELAGKPRRASLANVLQMESDSPMAPLRLKRKESISQPTSPVLIPAAAIGGSDSVLRPGADSQFRTSNIAFGMLLSTASGASVWVVTTHLFWDPKRHEVKLAQAVMLKQRLTRLKKESGPNVGIILCGDLNVQPHGAVYAYMVGMNTRRKPPRNENEASDGDLSVPNTSRSVPAGATSAGATLSSKALHEKVSEALDAHAHALAAEQTGSARANNEHDDENTTGDEDSPHLAPASVPPLSLDGATALSHTDSRASLQAAGPTEKDLSAPTLELRSVFHYEKEPEYTNFTQKFQGTLDYVFYDPDTIAPICALSTPPRRELQYETALPNSLFPSDHLATVVDLHWKAFPVPAEACKEGVRCRAPSCPLLHPSLCRNGMNCQSNECKLTHVTPCKYGITCSVIHCQFNHLPCPNGPSALRCGDMHCKYSHLMLCHFGPMCARNECRFFHPPPMRLPPTHPGAAVQAAAAAAAAAARAPPPTSVQMTPMSLPLPGTVGSLQATAAKPTIAPGAPAPYDYLPNEQSAASNVQQQQGGYVPRGGGIRRGGYRGGYNGGYQSSQPPNSQGFRGRGRGGYNNNNNRGRYGGYDQGDRTHTNSGGYTNSNNNNYYRGGRGGGGNRYNSYSPNANVPYQQGADNVDNARTSPNSTGQWAYGAPHVTPPRPN